MYKLLCALGYCIGDENGRQFRAWNIFDIICLLIYVGISTYNLWISKPEYCIWVLNLSIMGRIIARNRIEVKEIKRFYLETSSLPMYDFINWHSIKLAVEVTGTISSAIIFCVGVACDMRFGVKDNTFGVLFFIVGTLAIVVSSCEDLLKIIEKMYSARLPSQQATQENT